MDSRQVSRREFMLASAVGLGAGLAGASDVQAAASDCYEGRHFRGCGDSQYIGLLDSARRLFEPDPEFQNLPMLYTPQWNGLVEGPTWNMWWIQNSYGTTYCALPFLEEPFLTFIQNSQDLWFDQMGDGKREGCPREPRFNWVAPDGQLCDAASPGCIIYKQGDGRTEIHDWGLEFTAAGVLMQAELLLISRDLTAIARYLPKLERAVNFLETRRDQKNDLFRAGPAANLLAPSYAGWHRSDGTYGEAYLAGISITYIAALDRLIELEKLARAPEKVRVYAARRALARKGLPLLTADEGYFIKSLDPDGTRHGVFGADQHGYFEAVVNHDAIAFRVVDKRQAEEIYAKIASIPGLRPHAFIITNYPSLDDMYTEPKGLWRFGEWINGAAWSTCEARMILAYCRLGKHEDARRSVEKLFTFARTFRMDNPFTDFGDDVYQPKEPINLTYDAFGPAAAFIRGLFEYLYHADGLTLIPHIPATISQLQQLDPVRFGGKKLYLSIAGRGPVTSVTVNGKSWARFDGRTIFLPYDTTPDVAQIVISLGSGKLRESPSAESVNSMREPAAKAEPISPCLARLDVRAARLRVFHDRLTAELGASYEADHVRLALDAVRAIHERRHLLATGKLHPLPRPASQAAADESYQAAATKLIDGFEMVIKTYKGSSDPRRQKIYDLYFGSHGERPTIPGRDLKPIKGSQEVHRY